MLGGPDELMGAQLEGDRQRFDRSERGCFQAALKLTNSGPRGAKLHRSTRPFREDVED